MNVTGTPQTTQETHDEQGEDLFGPVGNDLDREAFLKMLVAQLNNQDPLNPQEGHEFAAQLAQFSTVEQLANLNDKMVDQTELMDLLAEEMGDSFDEQTDLLSNLRHGIEINRATSYIGQTVETPGNQFHFDGANGHMRAYLDEPAAQATISVLDGEGNVVRVFEQSNVPPGPQTLTWDGTLEGGQTAPPGVYHFEVDATSLDGHSVAVETRTSGAVDRVSYGPDGIELWVGALNIPLDNVEMISTH